MFSTKFIPLLLYSLAAWLVRTSSTAAAPPSLFSLFSATIEIVAASSDPRRGANASLDGRLTAQVASVVSLLYLTWKSRWTESGFTWSEADAKCRASRLRLAGSIRP